MLASPFARAVDTGTVSTPDLRAAQIGASHFLPIFYRPAESGHERALTELGKVLIHVARSCSLMLANVRTRLLSRWPWVRVPGAPSTIFCEPGRGPRTGAHPRAIRSILFSKTFFRAKAWSVPFARADGRPCDNLCAHTIPSRFSSYILRRPAWGWDFAAGVANGL